MQATSQRRLPPLEEIMVMSYFNRRLLKLMVAQGDWSRKKQPQLTIITSLMLTKFAVAIAAAFRAK